MEGKIDQIVSKTKDFMARLFKPPKILLAEQAEGATFVLRQLLGCATWEGYGPSNAALIADKVIRAI